MVALSQELRFYVHGALGGYCMIEVQFREEHRLPPMHVPKAPAHQTRQAFALTIACPGLQLNAF